MADINLAGFNFDPSKFQKVFGAGTLNYPLNLQPAVDPYAALHSKYRPLIEQRNKDLQQTSSQDKTGFGLALAAMNDPVTLMLQAELQKINAQNANEMSRENLKLAEEAAIRKQQRDFTLGQLSKTLESIPNAFSPIPFEKRQDVVANIANITSPRNLSPAPNISPGGYSYTPTRYYS